MSNYQISILIQEKLQEAFEETLDSALNSSLNPFKFDPIYGDNNIKFTNFLAPGMLCLIIFAHSIGIPAIAFVRERIDGSLDRVFAAGVPSSIIIAGHFMTHILINILQILLLLVIALWGLKLKIVGNIGVAFLVLFLLGITGMSFGLFIAGIANDEISAVQIAIASFFPSLLLSGTIWPVEAIPKWFSWISYSLPTTWSGQAMRSIMIRGWGLEHREVYEAIGITAAWATGFFIMATLLVVETDKRWFQHKHKKPETK